MLMRRPPTAFQFTHAIPYGAVIHESGVQFVVYSRSATAMRLLLYDRVHDREPVDAIPFDHDFDRLGDIWSLFVPGIGPGQLYHFQADGPRDPERGLWFDPHARLIDPYAKALAGCFQRSDDGIIRPPKCVVVDDYFEWEGDRHLRRDLSTTIIYEMHVRGFTISPTSGVRYPGTYLGVIEKIPYLKSLGITAVELMPVHEFPILDIWGNPPERPNYWGYDPLTFFAPHRGYAVGTEPGCQVTEFKQMVKALHQAGIEVILDVVFNHTPEGNERGPVLSFKGLENHVYYHIANSGSRYCNYSGCGNTINGNHPIVREMIFNCLRHWVHNYHVDGFRFDLASILSRNRHGQLVPNPPLVETIADDPLLADTKIIAEAWDAAGAYQVGCFSDHLRWAEWNGKYRDDVRRFWRGDAGTLGALATRLCGSSDLYKRTGRPPTCSINFITSHDGFTLHDLVTYKDKHNEANGEGNRDGENNNLSDNYGVEGPTRRKPIRELRTRQIKNMFATLLLSQGVPMIVSGDECCRTQQGNNNAYCQDNPISWFDWRLVRHHADIVRFVQALIMFRREQAAVRRKRFLTGKPDGRHELPDVNWFSPTGGHVDWANADLAMTCVLMAPDLAEVATGDSRHVMLMFNSTPHPLEFVVPAPVAAPRWRLFVDTGSAAPFDAYPNLDGPWLPDNRRVTLTYRSLRCYAAEP